MSTPLPKLLTRDAFREGVFARDGHLCVLCRAQAVDAHHILERRLWPDGGYYLENGASVCGPCHLACERTLVPVEEVRLACGIRKTHVPPHLYADQAYDKWGNPQLTDGRRLRGELFDDESVQKVLREGGVLSLFCDRVKYPRTHHLPWSPGVNDDDRVLEALDAFVGERVIVTEKMDGENTSVYRDGLHARSVDGRSHPSQAWVRAFGARVGAELPEGWRLCGENLYAKHSIAYSELPTYFMGFSLWNDRNRCLSWDDTQEWFGLLEVVSVPVLFDGIFDEKAIRALYNEKKDWGLREGYVVRLAREYGYGEFRRCVAKFVRKGHVQTAAHWKYGQRIVPNGLKG